MAVKQTKINTQLANNNLYLVKNTLIFETAETNCELPQTLFILEELQNLKTDFLSDHIIFFV